MSRSISKFPALDRDHKIQCTYSSKQLDDQAAFLQRSGIFLPEWILPYNLVNRSYCLKLNHPEGAGCPNSERTCTWTHRCLLCQKTGHGAFQMTASGMYKCQFHNEYVRESRLKEDERTNSSSRSSPSLGLKEDERTNSSPISSPRSPAWGWNPPAQACTVVASSRAPQPNVALNNDHEFPGLPSRSISTTASTTSEKLEPVTSDIQHAPQQPFESDSESDSEDEEEIDEQEVKVQVYELDDEGNQELRLKMCNSNSLGRSPHAEVFSATYSLFDEEHEVAVKVWSADQDKGKRKQLKKECKVLKKAGNHVVPMINIATKPYPKIDGRLYYFLIMEKCDQNLEQYITQTDSIKHEDMIHVARELVAAYADIHRLNIIHRDVKPENVLVNVRGGGVRLKLCDFAHSKKYQPGMSSATSSVAGTVDEKNQRCWVSPELLSLLEGVQGAKDLVVISNEQSDLWAVGCILCFIFTKKVPFKCRNDTRKAGIDEKFCNKKISDLLEHLPLICHLVTSMIQPNCDSRLPSGNALLHPCFWTSTETMEKIRHVVEFPNDRRKKQWCAIFEEQSLQVFPKGSNWSSLVKNPMWKTCLNHPQTKPYDRGLLYDLLRLVRNTIVHYQKLPQHHIARLVIRELPGMLIALSTALNQISLDLIEVQKYSS